MYPFPHTSHSARGTPGHISHLPSTQRSRHHSHDLQLMLTSYSVQPLTTGNHTPLSTPTGTSQLASPSLTLRAGPDHITGSLRPAVAPHSPRQSVGSFADFGCLLSVVCHGQPLGPQLTSAAIFCLCLPDSCQIQCVPSQHPLGKFCTPVSLNPQLLGSLPH